jgi:transposase
MAKAQMPDEFFEELQPHLPPEQPVGPDGGRPRCEHLVVMKVIWFVLVTGCRWEDVPQELGCSGRTAQRRLKAWEELGVWDHLHVHLLKLLRKADALEYEVVIVDSVIVRAFGGGEATGPSPVDRRKPGSKHTVMVDRNGAPLAIRTCRVMPHPGALHAGTSRAMDTGLLPMGTLRKTRGTLPRTETSALPHRGQRSFWRGCTMRTNVVPHSCSVDRYS